MSPESLESGIDRAWNERGGWETYQLIIKRVGGGSSPSKVYAFIRCLYLSAQNVSYTCLQLCIKSPDEDFSKPNPETINSS